MPVAPELRDRLERVPAWRRERFLAGLASLVGDMLLGETERTVLLVEVIERQELDGETHYRAQQMNSHGDVMAASWAPSRLEALEHLVREAAAGALVCVAVVCRRCSGELPPPAQYRAGARFTCQCGVVLQRSHVGGWREVSGL